MNVTGYDSPVTGLNPSYTGKRSRGHQSSYSNAKGNFVLTLLILENGLGVLILGMV